MLDKCLLNSEEQQFYLSTLISPLILSLVLWALVVSAHLWPLRNLYTKIVKGLSLNLHRPLSCVVSM